MGKTAILAIDELAPGQTQAFTTANNAFGALEQAANGPLSISAAGNATLTEIQFTRNAVFLMAAQAGDIDLIVPHLTNSLTTKRQFFVINNTGHNVRVKTDTAGLTVTIANGVAKPFLAFGADIYALA